MISQGALELWTPRVHLGMMCVWILLAYPAIVYWKESILYLIICSQYANIETSAAAGLAGLANRGKKGE